MLVRKTILKDAMFSGFFNFQVRGARKLSAMSPLLESQRWTTEVVDNSKSRLSKKFNIRCDVFIIIPQ